MKKSVTVRIIQPSKKLFFLMPVPVSQFVTFQECPGYTFAIHHPVLIRNDKLIVVGKYWAVSEVKTGLLVAVTIGTRASVKAKAVSLFERAKAFYKEADFIARASTYALSVTKDYKEGTF